MVALTSAAGLVGFLSEPDAALQVFALERLNEDIDSVWTEVSGSIAQMYVSSACAICCSIHQALPLFAGPCHDEHSIAFIR